MVLPCTSVIVIIVLLKVAFTCAMPELIFLRSRLRARGAAAGAADASAVSGFAMASVFSHSWGARRLQSRPSDPVVVREVGRALLGDFLLAGNRLRRTLTSPRVGVGALATHGQTLAMTQPSVAAEIHQPLDVH